MENNRIDITPEQLEQLIHGATRDNFWKKVEDSGLPIGHEGDFITIDPTIFSVRSALYLCDVYGRLCILDRDNELERDLLAILERYRSQYEFEEQCFTRDSDRN